MFTRRKSLSGREKYDRSFLLAFKNQLSQANLKNITVKLPHNRVHEHEESEIGIDEFIERGRNYPSIILCAQNETELLKVLLVNISSKAYFYDNVFPSGHSEISEVFVETADPVRTWGLFEYFYNYLRSPDKVNKLVLKLFSALLSLTLLIAESTTFLKTGELFLHFKYGYSLAYDIGIICISSILLYSFFSEEKGVYLKERKKGLGQFLILTLRGEYRDNPLVNLLFTIIGTIIATIIAALVLRYI
ncbi:MAG TPA: hypothetical protein VKZ95_03600 [Sphingobacteriaceae bacterium]|nr:hypothetical protein [Sphingobacteriaceae bacterium]